MRAVADFRGFWSCDYGMYFFSVFLKLSDINRNVS